LDIGVLGYIGIVQHKEHSPEVLHIPPGTPCIFMSWSNLRFKQCHESQEGLDTKTLPSTCSSSNLNDATTTTSITSFPIHCSLSIKHWTLYGPLTASLYKL